MRLRKIDRLGYVAFFVLFIGTVNSAVATRRERLIESWRPVRFAVALNFADGLDGLASASTSVRVAAVTDGLRTIDLDFGGLPIDGVSADGKPVQFQQGEGKLTVSL